MWEDRQMDIYSNVKVLPSVLVASRMVTIKAKAITAFRNITVMGAQNVTMCLSIC